MACIIIMRARAHARVAAQLASPSRQSAVPHSDRRYALRGSQRTQGQRNSIKPHAPLSPSLFLSLCLWRTVRHTDQKGSASEERARMAGWLASEWPETLAGIFPASF